MYGQTSKRNGGTAFVPPICLAELLEVLVRRPGNRGGLAVTGRVLPVFVDKKEKGLDENRSFLHAQKSLTDCITKETCLISSPKWLMDWTAS